MTSDSKSPRDWTPADWLAARADPPPYDRARTTGKRVRYRIARDPLPKPVRAHQMKGGSHEDA